jgi:hypothetical protein
MTRGGGTTHLSAKVPYNTNLSTNRGRPNLLRPPFPPSRVSLYPSSSPVPRFPSPPLPYSPSLQTDRLLDVLGNKPGHPKTLKP